MRKRDEGARKDVSSKRGSKEVRKEGRKHKKCPRRGREKERREGSR